MAVIKTLILVKFVVKFDGFIDICIVIILHLSAYFWLARVLIAMRIEARDGEFVNKVWQSYVHSNGYNWRFFIMPFY